MIESRNVQAMPRNESSGGEMSPGGAQARQYTSKLKEKIKDMLKRRNIEIVLMLERRCGEGVIECQRR